MAYSVGGGEVNCLGGEGDFTLKDQENPLQVAFTDFVFEQRKHIQLEGFEFDIHPPLRTAQQIINAAAEADVLCMRDQFGNVTSEVLEHLPDLKLIVTRSVGYDHIDLTAAHRRGVPVCNVPDYGAHMIAEHAFGLLLAVARKIVRGHERYMRERRFSDKHLQGTELMNKTIGVIGVGRIGKHTIRIAKGLGMHVLANDVHEDKDSAREMGFKYTSLENLLKQSDVVSLHVVLDESTYHLIDAERLKLVKPGSILINTARGSVVDTQALIQALRSGRLAGAGLDVLEGERDRYWDFDDLNVVVTPHLGWYTEGAARRILDATLEVLSAFRHGTLINRVELGS